MHDELFERFMIADCFGSFTVRSTTLVRSQDSWLNPAVCGPWKR